MEKKLNIYFTTDNKKTYHITLSHPKEDLTKATVAAVAQKMKKVIREKISRILKLKKQKR